MNQAYKEASMLRGIKNSRYAALCLFLLAGVGTLCAEGEFSLVHGSASINTTGLDLSASFVETSWIMPWLWIGVGTNLFTVTSAFDGYQISDRGKIRVFEYYTVNNYSGYPDTMWDQAAYFRVMKSWFPLQCYWIPTAYLKNRRFPASLSIRAMYCPWSVLGTTLMSLPSEKGLFGRHEVLDIGICLKVPFVSLIAGFNRNVIKETRYMPGNSSYYQFVHFMPYSVSRMYFGMDISLGKTFLGTKGFRSQFFRESRGWTPPPVWVALKSEMKTVPVDHAQIGKACEILVQERMNRSVVEEITTKLGNLIRDGADDSIVQFAIDHPSGEEGKRILRVMQLRKSRDVLESLFRKNAFLTMNGVVGFYALGYINECFSNDKKVRDPDNAGLLDSVIIACLQNASDTNVLQASCEGFILRTPMILKNGTNRILPAIERLSIKNIEQCERILLEISKNDADPEYFENFIRLCLSRNINKPIKEICDFFVAAHPLEAKEFFMQEMFRNQSVNVIFERILSENVNTGDFEKVKECIKALAPVNPSRSIMFLKLCKNMEGPAIKEYLLSLINLSYDKSIVGKAADVVRDKLTPKDVSAILELVRSKDNHIKTVGLDLLIPFTDNRIIDEVFSLTEDPDGTLARKMIDIVIARGNASQLLKLTVLLCKPDAKNSGFYLNALANRLDAETQPLQNTGAISGSDFSNFKKCLLESIDKNELNKYVALLKMCEKMGGFEAAQLYKEARARREVSVWKVVQAKGSWESYAAYLGEFPDGRWRNEAETGLDKAVFSFKKSVDFSHVLALTGTIVEAYIRTGLNIFGPNGGIRESLGGTDFVFRLKEHSGIEFQMTMETAAETFLIISEKVGDNLNFASAACEGARARVYYRGKGNSCEAVFVVKFDK